MRVNAGLSFSLVALWSCAACSLLLESPAPPPAQAPADAGDETASMDAADAPTLDLTEVSVPDVPTDEPPDPSCVDVSCNDVGDSLDVRDVRDVAEDGDVRAPDVAEASDVPPDQPPVVTCADDPCHELAVCTESGGEVVCTCTPGTIDASGDGATCARPKSCASLHAATPDLGGGAYWLDVDGAGGSLEPFITYCDMTRDGGGWTLISKVASGDYRAMTDEDYLALVLNPNAHVQIELLQDTETPRHGEMAFLRRDITNILYDASSVRNVRVEVREHYNVYVVGTYYQHRVDPPPGWDLWLAIRNARLWGDGMTIGPWLSGFGETFILNYGDVYDAETDTFEHGGDGYFGWWGDYEHTIGGQPLMVTNHGGLLNDGYYHGDQWLFTLEANDYRWKNDGPRPTLIWLK